MIVKNLKKSICIVLCILILGAFTACDKEKGGSNPGSYEGTYPVAAIEMERMLREASG